MIDWLPEDLPANFPATHLALSEPNANGLLAAGGKLTPEWLCKAYRAGIFPWYDKESPILWWSPAPRMVLFKENFRIGRSLRKALKKQHYTITCNQAFPAVVRRCAMPRETQAGTWITDEMKLAYLRMNINGMALSAEYWDERGNLSGGLYGVLIGSAFYGESMFSAISNASKITFACFADALFNAGVNIIDCQMHTDHLAGFGAEEIDRERFEQRLSASVSGSTAPLPTLIAKSMNHVR